ncbi:hypothetical protein BMS3Bbin01_02938 [bacterium BMS3Bbin01]|nr:hypothetical protein BMS3Bbin01_02938 [bacterium BMS3Bbin01]
MAGRPAKAVAVGAEVVVGAAVVAGGAVVVVPVAPLAHAVATSARAMMRMRVRMSIPSIVWARVPSGKTIGRTRGFLEGEEGARRHPRRRARALVPPGEARAWLDPFLACPRRGSAGTGNETRPPGVSWRGREGWARR